MTHLRISSLLLLASLGASAQTASLTFQGPDGITRPYQLTNHPRVWFTPDSAAALADPTPGSNSSHNAYYDDIMAQGLRKFITDGRNGYENTASGAIAGFSALMCWMHDTAKVPWDGSKTYCAYAKEALLGVRDATPFFFGGCVPLGNLCGTSYADYGGEWGQKWALAYTILRAKGLLNTEEIAAFANAYWNGIDAHLTGTQCTPRWVRGAGYVSRNGTNYTLASGYAWDSRVQVGAWIRFGVVVNEAGNHVLETVNSTWEGFLKVRSVNGQTITLNNPDNYGPVNYDDNGNFQKAFYQVLGNFSSTTCGMWQIFASHGAMMKPWVQAEMVNIASDLDVIEDWWDHPTGVDQTVDINNSNWTPGSPALPGTPSLSNPWSVILGVGGREYAQVIGKSGSTLTLRRGLWGETFAHTVAAQATKCCSNNKPYVGINYTNAGDKALPISDCTTGMTGVSTVSSGNCMGNLWLTRQQGFIALALAMADDDARAKWIAESMIDHWAKYSYPVAKEFYGPANFSALVNNYSYDRGDRFATLAWQISNSITHATGPTDFTGGSYLKERAGYSNIYWRAPWNGRKSGLFFGIDYISNAGNCPHNVTTQGICWMPAVQAGLLFPGTDAQKHAWYNMKTLGGALSNQFDTTTKISGALQQLPALLMILGRYRTWAESDYRSSINTARVWASSDTSTTAPLGTFASKSDWTDGATQLWGAYWSARSDKIFSPPATYAIGRNGWLLHQNQRGPFTHAAGTNFHDWNGPEIGPEYLNYYPVDYLNISPKQTMRGTVGPEFMFAEVDAKEPWSLNTRISDFNALANGGRVEKAFVHLKAGKEFIIAADSLRTSSNKRLRTKLQYENNSETHRQLANLGTSLESSLVVEGASKLLPAENPVYHDSSNGTSKLITQWLVGGGSGANRVYDLNISKLGNTFNVGPDCSTASPCRVRWEDGSVLTWTAPLGTWVFNASNGDNKEVRVWLDKADGLVKVAPQPGVTVTCTGSVSCVGDATDFPSSGTYLRLHTAKVSTGGADDSCPYDQFATGEASYSGGRGAHGWESGNCTMSAQAAQSTSYGTARSLWIDTGASTGTDIVVVHRPTDNLGETPDPSSLLAVTGSGADHLGVQINGSDPAVAILPRSRVSVDALSFTSTHSGTARLVVAGLLPGEYSLRRDGAAITTATVSYDDSAIYASGIGAGQIEIVRTAVLPLRIQTSVLRPGHAGSAYSMSLTAQGGRAPYRWTLQSGTLPAGLTLALNGVISGAATVAGTFEVTVQVSDFSNPMQTEVRPLQLVIQERLAESLPVRATLISDRAAEIQYGIQGLSVQSTCTLAVASDAAFSSTLFSIQDNGGPAIRRTVLGAGQPLDAGQLYFVGVTCGVRSGLTSFYTWRSVTPVSAGIAVQSAPPSQLNVASLRVEYGSTTALGAAATSTCAGICRVDLTAPAHALLFQRRTYLDSANQPVAVSQTAPIRAR